MPALSAHILQVSDPEHLGFGEAIDDKEKENTWKPEEERNIKKRGGGDGKKEEKSEKLDDGEQMEKEESKGTSGKIDTETMSDKQAEAPAAAWELHDSGADVNATDPIGYSFGGTKGKGATALILAALNGHGDVVRQLLDAGADTTLEDKEGNSFLTALRDDLQKSKSTAGGYLALVGPRTFCPSRGFSKSKLR